MKTIKEVEARRARINLNEQRAWGDGAPQLQDFSVDLPQVSVILRDLKKKLIWMIRDADYVFGCVAWLTDLDILAELAKKKRCNFVVQKEDFLRPEQGAPSNWKQTLHAAYGKLRGAEHLDFPLLSRLREAGADAIEPVRCVGVQGEGSRMHHKFAVFCRARSGPQTFAELFCEDHSSCDESILQQLREDESDPSYFNFVPYAVWTGSFNWTFNSTHSLENAVLLQHNEAVRAYYREFVHVLTLSESLDWFHEYVSPDWKFS
jgi:hypothetical protein